MMRVMRRSVPSAFSGRLLRAKKSLGQHFLMHAATAERIADAACLTKTSTVLEIGPGEGALTRALLSRAGKVVAVEADAVLAKKLIETFHAEVASGALAVRHEDIRAFDARAMPSGYALVANIPYYLTGDIFRRFLSGEKQPASMTLLVQKEVAERIARAKKESLLSLSVKAYGTPRYCFTVPRGAFVPAPSVDSAVLTVSDISRARFASEKEERFFFALLRLGFAHKRKQLFGNLRDAYPSAALTRAFLASRIEERARAEDLSLETWRALARALTSA